MILVVTTDVNVVVVVAAVVIGMCAFRRRGRYFDCVWKGVEHR